MKAKLLILGLCCLFALSMSVFAQDTMKQDDKMKKDNTMMQKHHMKRHHRRHHRKHHKMMHDTDKMKKTT